jgi:hypothetical protein
LDFMAFCKTVQSNHDYLQYLELAIRLPELPYLTAVRMAPKKPASNATLAMAAMAAAAASAPSPVRVETSFEPGRAVLQCTSAHEVSSLSFVVCIVLPTGLTGGRQGYRPRATEHSLSQVCMPAIIVISHHHHPHHPVYVQSQHDARHGAVSGPARASRNRRWRRTSRGRTRVAGQGHPPAARRAIPRLPRSHVCV